MFKRFFVPVILFLIVAMALSGCSGSEEADDGQKKVAVLFPFLIDDGAWNEEGYKGLLEAEKEGIKIAYTEQVRQAEQIEVFRNYAQEGYDVIIGHGGEYMQAALTVAKNSPKPCLWSPMEPKLLIMFRVLLLTLSTEDSVVLSWPYD